MFDWKLVEQVEESVTLRKGLLKVIYNGDREFTIPLKDTIVDIKKGGLFSKTVDFKISMLEEAAYDHIGDIMSGSLCRTDSTTIRYIPTDKIEYFEIVATHANAGAVTLYRKKFKRIIF